MKKRTNISLGILQSFVAIMALPAGLSLLFDPTGEGLGIPLEFLEATPFTDFFIPALFLFVGNGLCHVAGAVLTFRKNKYAGTLGIGLGVFLVLWIIIQVYFIGLIHFLQPLFFVVAIVEIILGVKVRYKLNKSKKMVALRKS